MSPAAHGSIGTVCVFAPPPVGIRFAPFRERGGGAHC
jgi:hypothetical protein